MNTPAVEVRGVSRSFGPVAALVGVDLTVGPAEFVAVMGPSGSGKSTLLHLIAGLDTPDAGEVLVEGRSLAGMSEEARTVLRRRRLGVVFQSFNLVDVLTAEENVALPLVLDGVSEREAGSRARAALDEVGLGGRAGAFPPTLSGGEGQRVAIARALAVCPALVLADEPTGNLDSRAGEGVIGLLRRLADERRQAVLLVTHDAGHAARADRLVRLRDGRVTGEQALPRGVRPLGQVLGEWAEG